MKKQISSLGGGYGWSEVYYDEETGIFTEAHYHCGSVDMSEEHFDGEEVIDAASLLASLIRENRLSTVIEYRDALRLTENLDTALNGMKQSSWIDDTRWLSSKEFTYYRWSDEEYVIFYGRSYFSVKQGQGAAQLSESPTADFSVVKRILEHWDHAACYTYNYFRTPNGWDEKTPGCPATAVSDSAPAKKRLGYTLCSDRKRTIAQNYHDWQAQHQHEPELLQMADLLLQHAIKEVHSYDPAVGSTWTEDEKVRCADHLACLSAEYHSGFCNHGTCTHIVRRSYRSLVSSHCIYCTIFALCFCGNDHTLLLDPALVHEFAWPQLRALLPHTNLKHIGLELPCSSLWYSPENPDERLVAKLWDAATDTFWAIYEMKTGSFEEIEDGYPIEIDQYREDYRLTDADPSLLWLAQPKMDRTAASKKFYENEADYRKRFCNRVGGSD